MLHIRSALDSERLDRVEGDLREVGFHIIENVISDDEADEAREVIWKLVEEDIANGFDHSYGDGKIRRVWAIVAKAPIFRRFIQHPTVVAVWKRMLGEDVIASTFYSEYRRPRGTRRRLAYRLPVLGDASTLPVGVAHRTDRLDVRRFHGRKRGNGVYPRLTQNAPPSRIGRSGRQ